MIRAGTTCTVYALYCPVWTTQCRVNLKRFMQEMQPLQDQTTDNPPPCYSYFQLTYVFVIFPLQCRLLPTSLSYMIHHLFPFLYLASIHPPPPYSFFFPPLYIVSPPRNHFNISPTPIHVLPSQLGNPVLSGVMYNDFSYFKLRTLIHGFNEFSNQNLRQIVVRVHEL